MACHVALFTTHTSPALPLRRSPRTIIRTIIIRGALSENAEWGRKARSKLAEKAADEQNYTRLQSRQKSLSGDEWSNARGTMFEREAGGFSPSLVLATLPSDSSDQLCFTAKWWHAMHKNTKKLNTFVCLSVIWGRDERNKRYIYT